MSTDIDALKAEVEMLKLLLSATTKERDEFKHYRDEWVNDFKGAWAEILKNIPVRDRQRLSNLMAHSWEVSAVELSRENEPTIRFGKKRSTITL